MQREPVIGVNFSHYQFPGPRFVASKDAEKAYCVALSSVIALLPDIRVVLTDEALQRQFHYVEGVLQPIGAAGTVMTTGTMQVFVNKEGSGNILS
jgi:hypothetical protein